MLPHPLKRGRGWPKDTSDRQVLDYDSINVAAVRIAQSMSMKITRRAALRQVGAAVSAMAAPLRASAHAEQPGRPHVLLVIADDMRWDLMGCAGHPFIRTPNLDRLSREGARFTNAFVCMSLCSPSRASILTGLYPHVHGVWGNRTPLDFARLTTVPQVFQRAGYRTAMFGKWHMGVDVEPKPGFDHWACFRGQGTYFDPELNLNGRLQTFEGFTDDVTTAQACDWIEAAPDRPSLTILGYKSCHSPFEPAPRAANLYSGVTVPRPATFDKPAPDQPAWIQKFDDTGHTPYSRIPFDELALRFARLVSGIDDNIGVLLKRLESIGQLDNTVVIFTSDNGFLLHEHGLYDKRAMYEESIRVPLLIRYPRVVTSARTIDDMTLNVDLAPTLLELIRQPSADRMQGISVLGALRGGRGPRRNAFFYQYDRETPYSTPSLMGVRTAEWKLVKYQEEGQVHELYRLSKDPHETTNLFLDASHARQRARLERELERLAQLAKVKRPIR